MKTKALFLICLLAFVSGLTVSAQSLLLGDTDQNGKLTIADITKSVNMILGKEAQQTLDLSPYRVDNSMVVGTWYMPDRTSFTFSADGTTTYPGGVTYEFMPSQGRLLLYDATGVPVRVLSVVKVTKDYLLTVNYATETITQYTSTKPVILVTGITLSATSLTLQLDGYQKLTATVLPANADNPKVSWTSSNTSVAEVASNGGVTAIGEGTCTITCSATDGSGVEATCTVTVMFTCPDGNHPHAIDLGLSSGTKWCCCNVGATAPEGYGGYYAWGETSEKSVYNWDTYQYGSSWDNVVNIGSDIAGTNYDVAHVRMGAPWRMPSTAQQQELINNCSYLWTQQNGVNGILVTGPNGGKIFLPAAGSRWDDALDNGGEYGGCWSSSLHPGYDGGAFYMVFDSDSWDWYSSGRGSGLSVRAVCP